MKISCQVIGHGNRRYIDLYIGIVQYLKPTLSARQDKIAEDPSTIGSTFMPIILGSDKMTVLVATGQNDYWPVYLSIGNIHNNVRHTHCNGVKLLAFLAIPKGLLLR